MTLSLTIVYLSLNHFYEINPSHHNQYKITRSSATAEKQRVSLSLIHI